MIDYIKEKLNDAGVKKYTSNTLWLFCSRFINLAFSYIATIYVVRYLGPTTNGLLVFSVSFVGIFSVISNFGLDSILLEKISRAPEEKDKILGTAISVRFFTAMVATVTAIIASFVSNNDNITTLLIVINTFSLIFSAPTLISYYFQSRAEGKYQALAHLIISITLSIAKITAAYLNLNIIIFAIILASENIIGSIYWIICYKKTNNNIFNLSYDKTIAKSLIFSSFPLLLSNAAIVIYTRADQILLKYIIDVRSVGIYDAAVRVSELWYFIPSMVVISLFPAIINAHKNDEELFKKRLTLLYSALIYVSTIVGILMTIFAEKIILVLYGPEFYEGAIVLKIYAWATIPMSMTIIMNTYLLLINKNKITFISSIVGMVANVGLNFILIPIYGLKGAAIATIISYTLVPLTPLLFPSIRNQGKIIREALILPVNIIEQIFKNRL